MLLRIGCYMLSSPTQIMFCNLLEAGDLNRLSGDKVIEATGLLSLVKQPTRGDGLLNRLYASEDCFSSLWVLTSVVKSDHRAIIVVSSGLIATRAKTKTWVLIRRRSPQPSLVPSRMPTSPGSWSSDGMEPFLHLRPSSAR